MSELLHTFRRKNLREKAATLVVTLLVLTLLSTIVVAFVQTVSLERSAARSVFTRYQAELAADAGAQFLAAALPEVVGTNFGFAVISTNVATSLAPIPMLVGEFPPAASNSLPLASGPLTNFLATRASNSNSLPNFLAAVADTSASNSTDANRSFGSFKVIEQTNTARFNAPWIYLTNSAGTTNARVAFYVVDDQAKLNLALHGTSTNTNRAGWSSDPSKVPISITGTNALLNTTSASAFANATNKEIYLNNLGHLFANRADYEQKKHLFTIFSGKGGDFIPSGYTNTNGTFVRYAQAGQPKYDINDLATNTVYGADSATRASNIANLINTNLTNFRTRDVSMSNGLSGNYTRYLNRITASIVDYIDTDSAATVLPDGSPEGEPSGKELAPLITSIAEKYNWIQETGGGNSWDNTIVHKVFVQLWNPYQTNVAGNFSFQLISKRPVIMPGAVGTDMPTVFGNASVTLRPNETKVFAVGASTNIVNSSIQASLNVDNHPYMPATSSNTTADARLHTRFKASWNNSTMDRTPNDSIFFLPNGPGLAKDSVGNGTSTRIILNGRNRYSINYPNFGSSSPDKGFRGSSDPRQNYIARYVWLSAAQNNADVRWNGRNNDALNPNALGGDISQDYNQLWRARDYIRANPRVGSEIDLDNNEPTDAASVYELADSNDAPFFIRNNLMENIAELGNIYDPACLNDVGFSTKGSDPESWYASGGARSLRVGMPEFEYPTTNSTISPTATTEKRAPNWKDSGMRSIHFLDLFTTARTNSIGVPEMPSRININTAPREVLAASLVNISQNADLAYTNSIMTSQAAFSIADHIISNRPYLNKADFHKFTDRLLNPTNFLPQLGAVSATNLAAINDPGREQIFASINDLFDTKSQTFRIYSIGQALGTNNQVLSEAIVETLLRFDIQRNTTGRLRMVPVVLYRRNL
jgi:hypothetical protein